MSRRTYLRNAFETTITAGITAGASSIPLASVTGLTAPGYLVIDHDDPAKREYIKFAGISTLDLTGCTRGLTGSAGGAGSAHDSGATIKAVSVQQLFEDLFSDVEDLETQDTTHDAAISALEAADSAHFGSGGSVHSTVIAAGDAGFMSGSDKSKLDGIEPGATGDQSAAEILSSLSTVDGSESSMAFILPIVIGRMEFMKYFADCS